MHLKIGTVDVSDILPCIKVTYTTMLSEDSGRNAKGDNVVDVVNRKVKITGTTPPLSQAQMSALLLAIKPYVVSVSYLDPESGAMKTISAYPSAPAPEYISAADGTALYKPMELSLVEM